MWPQGTGIWISLGPELIARNTKFRQIFNECGFELIDPYLKMFSIVAQRRKTFIYFCIIQLGDRPAFLLDASMEVDQSEATTK